MRGFRFFVSRFIYSVLYHWLSVNYALYAVFVSSLMLHFAFTDISLWVHFVFWSGMVSYIVSMLFGCDRGYGEIMHNLVVIDIRLFSHRYRMTVKLCIIVLSFHIDGKWKTAIFLSLWRQCACNAVAIMNLISLYSEDKVNSTWRYGECKEVAESLQPLDIHNIPCPIVKRERNIRKLTFTARAPSSSLCRKRWCRYPCWWAEVWLCHFRLSLMWQFFPINRISYRVEFHL